MVKRRLLILLGVGAGFPAWGCTSPAPSRIRVGPPVQVSAARSGEAHYEVVAAAHPMEADRLLVASMLQPAESGTVSGSIAYVSDDGGATWREVLETPPADSRAFASGDPAVAWGPGGEAYLVASLIPPTSDRSARRMLLYRSSDGGRTWAGPVRFTYSDREYIVVDATSGPYRGRVYVNGNGRIGQNAGGLTSFYSSDGGGTFTESAPRQPTAPVMGNAVVLSDGTLVALHSAEDATAKSPASGTSSDAIRVNLRVSASRDGGRTFGDPTDIATATLVSGRKGGHNNTSNLPVLAVDASARASRDRLYVVWPEHDGAGTSIVLSSSADGGATWSVPAVVSDAKTPGRDHFMPALAVNPDGVVAVTWYDRRDREDDIGWDVRFAASVDGGETFLPSVVVSGAGTRFGATDAWIVEAHPTPSPDGPPTLDLSLNTFTFLGGDTAGLVADASGVFHPVWVDNSSGIPQVWTTRVEVGAAGPTGASSAAGTARAAAVSSSAIIDSAVGSEAAAAPPHSAAPLSRRGVQAWGRARDVTGRVSLEATRPRYDRSTNVLTVRVRLLNESTEPIRGPIVLTAGAIGSELGTPGADNADSMEGSTMSWLLESPGHGSLVAPGTWTAPRELAFRLTGLQPFRDGNRFRRGLIRFAWTATVY